MCACVCLLGLVCVCVLVGKEKKGSTRVERLLSASSARGNPAATPALAY